MFQTWVLFFGMVAFVTSCKKDNNTGGTGNGGATTSLTVILSKTTVDIVSPENVIATVKDQNNIDVTSSCSIKVNGTAIIAATFTPITVGTYTFVATKDSITSSPVTLNVINSEAPTDSL